MSSMFNIYGVWSRGVGGAYLAVTQDLGFCSLLELPLLIKFNDTEGAHKDLAPRPLILHELTFDLRVTLRGNGKPSLCDVLPFKTNNEHNCFYRFIL